MEKLRELIPRALFTIKIQSKINGADSGGSLHRSDEERRDRLFVRRRHNQEDEALAETEKGKEKMKKLGKSRADIPHDVFIKMMQG